MMRHSARTAGLALNFHTRAKSARCTVSSRTSRAFPALSSTSGRRASSQCYVRTELSIKITKEHSQNRSHDITMYVLNSYTMPKQSATLATGYAKPILTPTRVLHLPSRPMQKRSRRLPSSTQKHQPHEKHQNQCRPLEPLYPPPLHNLPPHNLHAAILRRSASLKHPSKPQPLLIPLAHIRNAITATPAMPSSLTAR